MISKYSIVYKDNNESEIKVSLELVMCVVPDSVCALQWIGLRLGSVLFFSLTKC